MIFVFGSNKSGIHGAGAAKYAYDFLGAEWGVGQGFTGECYALPTKGYRITPMTLEEVRTSVNTFISIAKSRFPKFGEEIFKVTQVGCGLGGFTAEEIAPLFINAPDNCHFDEAWRHILEPYGKRNYWGTF